MSKETKRDAYLMVSRMANSDAMVLELKDKEKREVITISLADFSRLITGQLLQVEVEEKKAFK